MRKIFGLWLGLLLASVTAEAQYKAKFDDYTSFEAGIGGAWYYGDLAPIKDFLQSTIHNTYWNVSVGVNRQISRRFEIGAGLMWARLGADDIHSSKLENYARNLHFRNDVNEASLQLRYLPFTNASSQFKRNLIQPYIGAGIGYYIHNPKAKIPVDMGDQWVALQPLGTEGQNTGNEVYATPYALNGISIPISIGIRMKYKRNIDIAFELGYRVLFTDYIDDVSSIYPNTLLFSGSDRALVTRMSRRVEELIHARTGQDRTSQLIYLLEKNNLPTNDPLSELASLGGVGSKRGTVDGNDSYLVATVKIRYLIPTTIKCPKLK